MNFGQNLYNWFLKHCTEPCAYGNRSDWNLFRIQTRVFQTYRLSGNCLSCWWIGIQCGWCKGCVVEPLLFRGMHKSL